MHKKLSEKIRDFFINLGKHHRLLLPVAVIGLFITMLVTKVVDYCRRGTKRFACVFFVACMFLLGNSFAFPIFNFSNGFVGENVSNEVFAAADSELSLANTDIIVNNDDDSVQDGIPGEEISDTEYGTVNQEETYSLEDILAEVGIDSDNIEVTKENEYEGSFEKDDWRLILINKQHPIPDDYSFSLGTLKGSMQCDERIIDELLLMMKEASDQGVSLVVCSPFRDLEKQESLFERKINTYMKRGYSYMDAYKISSQAVTVPGASEHQVGLAVDIISNNYTVLDEGFEDTEAGKWLKEHCQEYGFILRYPKDKEYITSIEYEPWHFRYVGKKAAEIIMKEGITLEEFWEKYI